MTAAEVAFDSAKEGAFDTKRESGAEKTVTEGMTELGAVGMDMGMEIEKSNRQRSRPWWRFFLPLLLGCICFRPCCK